MHWSQPYSAVFFDLDGLLVNTEELHWKAYKDMCFQNGVHLPWGFEEYYTVASRSATGIQMRLKIEYPQLFHKKGWDELYHEKKQNLQNRIEKDTIPLMPGVEEVLSSLKDISLPIAVVTHSPSALVEHIKEHHACFSVIQKWFPRETYLNPKPAPDGYITAAHFFEVEPQKCIGFEDSLRGIEALSSACVTPILVQKYDQAARASCQEKGIRVLSQIDEILS